MLKSHLGKVGCKLLGPHLKEQKLGFPCPPKTHSSSALSLWNEELNKENTEAGATILAGLKKQAVVSDLRSGPLCVHSKPLGPCTGRLLGRRRVRCPKLLRAEGCLSTWKVCFWELF